MMMVLFTIAAMSLMLFNFNSKDDVQTEYGCTAEHESYTFNDKFDCITHFANSDC